MNLYSVRKTATEPTFIGATLLIAVSLLIPLASDAESWYPPATYNGTFESGNDSPEQLVGAVGGRVKRIIHGLAFLDIANAKQTINAVNYFVVISHSHQCTFKHMLKMNLDYAGVTMNLTGDFNAHCIHTIRNPRCSGALIAPSIVQTACHCLASFYKFQPSDKRANALEKSVWEDHNIIFRPAEDPSDEYRPRPSTRQEKQRLLQMTLAVTAERQFMFSKKYYVHQRCTHLDKRVYSHDFGVIILNENFLDVPKVMWKDPRPKLKKNQYITAIPPDVSPKSLAPLYTIAAAEQNWIWVNHNQPMCLILGTGWSIWAYGIYLELPPRPWDIIHTWRSAGSYTECAQWVKREMNFQYQQTGSNTNRTNMFIDLNRWVLDGMNVSFRDLATWICTAGIPKLGNAYASMGDDGGPVTCSNRYVGVLGAGFPVTKKFSFLSEVELLHAINYAPETLAEYRQSFIELALGFRPEPKFVPFHKDEFLDEIPEGDYSPGVDDSPLVKRSVQEPYDLSPTSGLPPKRSSYQNFFLIALLFVTYL